MRAGPQLFHHMQGDRRFRFRRKRIDSSLYEVECPGAKVFLRKWLRCIMVLVGKDGGAHARLLDALEHLAYAGIDVRVVLFVLRIVRAELAVGALEHDGVASVLGGHETLDEFEHAVSHLIAIGVDGKRGPSMRFADMVARARKVFERVEQRAVHIKNHVHDGHETSRGDANCVDGAVAAHSVAQSRQRNRGARRGTPIFKTMDMRALGGPPPALDHAVDLFDKLLFGKSAYETANLGAIVEDDERGDGHDAVLEGDLFILVHVALGYGDDICHIGCDFIDHGRNHATWPAPGGPEVNEHGLWAVQNIVEIGGGDLLDCCHGKLLYSMPGRAGRMFTRLAYTQRRGAGSGGVEVYLSQCRWCAAR